MHIYLHIYIYILYALKGGLAGQKYKSEIFLRTRGPIRKKPIDPPITQLTTTGAKGGIPSPAWICLVNKPMKTGHLRNHPRLTSHPHPCSNKYILIDSLVSSSMVYIHYHSVNALPIFGTRNHFDLAQSYSKFGPSSSIHHYNCVFHSLDLWKPNLFGPCHVRPLGPHHCQLLFGIEATIVLIPLVAHQVCCIAMENHHKSPIMGTLG